jgi:tripartite motif-containing protein 71
MKQTILWFLSALVVMVSCQPAPTPTSVPPTSTMPAPTNTIALPTPTPPKVSPLVFVAKMTGDANDPLWAPMAFAFDKQGNIYVADAANRRIFKFDPNGKTLAQWGSSGSGEGQFSFQHIPGGIAIDDQGNVFVIDDGNARIEKFDGNGKFLTQWGSKGTGDGQFTTPQNLVVDSQGSVYVLDFYLANVQKFDGNGKFMNKLGGFGSENGQFRTPHGLAVDGQGNIYVGDALGYFQKFDRDGKFLTKFAVPNCPWIDGLTVDAQGNVYAFQLTGTEIKQPSICIFDSTGKALGIWQNYGSDDGQWKALYGIHVDAQGYIYILDRGNYRIQKLQQP